MMSEQIGEMLRQVMLDYETLAVQRDEGLAREAELQLDVDSWKETAKSFEDFYRKTEVERDAFEQRLAEAKRLLLDVRGQLCGPDQRAIDVLLASSDCADEGK